jgi:hypothetical protein
MKNTNQKNSNIIGHYFQRNRNNPEFKLVKYGDRLSIPGRLGFYAFGSVVGYTTEYNDDVEEALKRARDNHHQVVWVNALCSVIDCSGKSAEEKAMQGAPHGATLHTDLEIGMCVWFEGNSYRLDKAPNDNIGLTKVDVHFDGTIVQSK